MRLFQATGSNPEAVKSIITPNSQYFYYIALVERQLKLMIDRQIILSPMDDHHDLQIRECLARVSRAGLLADHGQFFVNLGAAHVGSELASNLNIPKQAFATIWGNQNVYVDRA